MKPASRSGRPDCQSTNTFTAALLCYQSITEKVNRKDETSDRKTLAREILDEAWQRWSARAPNVLPHMKLIAADNTVYTVFANRPEVPFGHLIYSFVPAQVVESILAECERIFYLDERRHHWSEEDRAGTVRSMALNATEYLLTTLAARLSDVLQIAFDESLLQAEAIVQAGSANQVGGIADARAAIEELVSICADRQRLRLSSELKSVIRSDVRVPTDDPRLPKLTRGRVRIAIKALGANANKKTVASRLGVTEKTLYEWAKSEGFSDWKAAQRHFEVGSR